MNTSKLFNNNETTETDADFTGHKFDEFTGNEFNNFDNEEFKNSEFENTEFKGGEFAEGEFNNAEFNGNEFGEDSFNNNEFGTQESKFERKDNMSDNFGSKFATLILAIVILTLSASEHRAASVSYSSHDEYNNSPAVESHYAAGSHKYKTIAAYMANGNSYSYNYDSNIKNAEYYAYPQHRNVEYQSAAHQNVYMYKTGRVYYNVDHTATGRSLDSYIETSDYEIYQYGYNGYKEV